MAEPITKPLLRFKHIRIEGLFGPENPDIEIPFNLDERVTILHGRNGSGKTVTLRLLTALRAGDVSALARYPFKRLSVTFEPSARLEIQALEVAPRNRIKEGESHFEFTIHEDGSQSITAPVSSGKGSTQHDRGPSLAGFVEERLPWLDRISHDTWFDPRSNTSMRLHEVIDRYGLLPGIQYSPVLVGLDHRLSEFIGRLPFAKLITADRLFVRGVDADVSLQAQSSRHFAETGLMVDRLSQDIRDDVQQVDRDYRLTSTRLDSSLRRRLFQKPEAPPGLAELKFKNLELDREEQLLLSMGLLREAPDKVDADEITEENRDQHFVLLEDREEKLAVFRNIVAKAQRLLESLNKKLAPKTVRLDVEKGYEVRTSAGNVLPLESLSSGEQHELVLLHELLFDVPSGSLILIDEPELSLHVTWQKDLLPELLDIARIANLDFVLATHSPYIVGDRHDLMVRLGEPV